MRIFSTRANATDVFDGVFICVSLPVEYETNCKITYDTGGLCFKTFEFLIEKLS